MGEPVEVIMPQVWGSIEGEITRWFVQVGAVVERNQPLFEIATDKVDAEVPSPHAGVLSRVFYPEGATVPINTVVALIDAGNAVTHTPSIQEGAVPPTWDLGDFTLRPLRLGDEVAWAGYLSDSRVTQHTTFGAVDVETVATAVRRHIAEYSAATACRWALANLDGDLIGTCGLLSWSLVHSHAELVYDLAPAYWRRGYIRRSVNAVLNWAFSTAGFNRVHAYVMTTNAPSIALLERTGFAREGTLRQFRIARNTPRDFYVYALLRQDFGK